MCRPFYKTVQPGAINNAVRTLFIEDVSTYLHGETVAIGLLAQLVYNKEEEKIEDLYKMMRAFHCPCRMEEIGVEPTEEHVELLEKRLCKHPFMKKDDEHYERLRVALKYIAGGKYDFESNER